MTIAKLFCLASPPSVNGAAKYSISWFRQKKHNTLQNVVLHKIETLKIRLTTAFELSGQQE